MLVTTTGRLEAATRELEAMLQNVELPDDGATDPVPPED
jgi:hypothetical protein